MKALATISMLMFAPPALGQGRPPVIDMHLHASAAVANGPPPLALCVPLQAIPLREPGKTWEEVFIAWQKNPPCPDPVWSPATDEALMKETIAASSGETSSGF